MSGTVSSNQNNQNQTVYYNGQAYVPETKGNVSYIKVGNHTVSVDLNDPTWFQQQVHGDYSVTQMWQKENDRLEEEKSDSKKWLNYFQDKIEAGKKAWTAAREQTRAAAEERYNSGRVLKQLKAKQQAILAEAKAKKVADLQGSQKHDAVKYDAQIKLYTEQREEYTSEMYSHIRERLRADADIQSACIGAAREVSTVGKIEMQQIVNNHAASLS